MIKLSRLYALMVAVVAIGLSPAALAVTCDELEFIPEITNVLPEANEACLGVVERDGRPYAEFKARIVRNRGGEVRAQFRRADGTWSETHSFRPDMSRRITIGGQTYRMRDMQRGQELNIYLPPDRFEIAVAEDDDLTIAPVTVTVMRLTFVGPELPTTASPLPLIGMLGTLFVALGASLTMIRRRLSRRKV